MINWKRDDLGGVLAISISVIVLGGAFFIALFRTGFQVTSIDWKDYALLVAPILTIIWLVYGCSRLVKKRGEPHEDADQISPATRPDPPSVRDSNPSIEPKFKRHVFLSYCRQNRDEVRRLRDELIKAGEPVWWDQEILPGQNWEIEINKAMKAAYAVVLCLSKESQSRTSTGIYVEARNAIEAYRQYSPEEIFLIPVRLSDCEIPFFKIDATTMLDGLQFVDLFPPAQRSKGFEKLVQALRAVTHHPLQTP
jgi:hypothetical protein